MNEFDKNPSAIETRTKDEERKHHTVIGQLLSKPGLILFEFEESTGIIREAEIKEVQVQMDVEDKLFAHIKNRQIHVDNVKSEVTVHKKVIYKSGCTYLQAINRKNAIRKLSEIFKTVG